MRRLWQYNAVVTLVHAYSFCASGAPTLNNSSWRISSSTQKPAFTLCSRGTFLLAFQLVWDLILCQIEPYQNDMGLWLEHHTASLSVSNQPVDAYYVRAWAPWGKTWRATARCSLPWWKWSSPWTWSDATEAIQAECKTPGWVASESLQGLDSLGFPLLASQDGSHSLLPSVHLKPNTSSHRPVRTSSDQSTTMSPILARSWGEWRTVQESLQAPDMEYQVCVVFIPKWSCLRPRGPPEAFRSWALMPDPQGLIVAVKVSVAEKVGGRSRSVPQCRSLTS